MVYAGGPISTVKLSNITWANPGPSLDSMIMAGGPLEWTCNLGQWAPSTSVIAAMNFTGCPYSPTNNCPSGTIGLATDLTSATDLTPGLHVLPHWPAVS